APPQQEPAGSPNDLSAEEVPYYPLLEMHRSTILSDPVGPLPRISPLNVGPAHDQTSLPNLARDAPLGPTARQRRSALDFDARTPPMERDEVEQLLDSATRDWPADWRGNFGGETTVVETGTDFVR